MLSAGLTVRWGARVFPLPPGTGEGARPRLRQLSAAAPSCRMPRYGLPGGADDVGGGNVGSVPVQAPAGPVISLIVVRGSAWEVASCTSSSGTPASKTGNERFTSHAE